MAYKIICDTATDLTDEMVSKMNVSLVLFFFRLMIFIILTIMTWILKNI